MFNGFDPVYDKNSRVLILGSFPSVVSREVGFYYGNKQNRFWGMIEKVFDVKIGQDTQCKIEFLLKKNIALFDVVECSDLIGSADTTLARSNLKVSDISFLLPPHTKVEKIICNGKTSFMILNKSINTDIPIFCLPSTSPANVRYNYDEWCDALSFLK